MKTMTWTDSAYERMTIALDFLDRFGGLPPECDLFCSRETFLALNTSAKNYPGEIVTIGPLGDLVLYFGRQRFQFHTPDYLAKIKSGYVIVRDQQDDKAVASIYLPNPFRIERYEYA